MTSTQYRIIENRLFKKLHDRLIYEIDPENKFIYLKKFSILTKNLNYGIIITNSDNEILYESTNKIQPIIFRDLINIKRRFLDDKILIEFLVKDIDSIFEISYIGECF